MTTIAAEGNLPVVDWLEPACRREIVRYSKGDAEEAIAELAQELLDAR